MYKIKFSSTYNEHRNNRKCGTTVLIYDCMSQYNMMFNKHGDIYNNNINILCRTFS